MQDDDDADTIRILVTTDNHVGYNETDPIRGTDAAATFDEIMELAKQNDVDMVIQGGDLFHSNKPSRQTLYNVIKSIRRTCLGDKPVQLEVLNHGMLDMDDPEFDHINYMDTDLNVSIPIFAISGNHDDAGGQAMLSAMDVLAATGLVNHFGRVFDLAKVTIEPILLRKGNTKLALYGMASMREERLKRAFRDGCVKFLKAPAAETEWYNIMMVHQNHNNYHRDNYLPETVIPTFMDTVVWGHEHACLIEPRSSVNGAKIIQPGSSVATSLCEAEAMTKYVCILTIKGKECGFTKIPLKSVRPFVMKTVTLGNVPELASLSGAENKGKVTAWLMDTVNDLITDARDEWLANQTHPETAEVPLPLVRLNIDYTGGYELENPTRFSKRFSGQVANESDIVHYIRQKTVIHRRHAASSQGGMEVSEGVEFDEDEQPGMDESVVHQLAEEFLGNKKLNVLLETSLGDAVRQFVQDDSGNKNAVKNFVDEALIAQMQNLLSAQVEEDNEDELLKAMSSGKLLQENIKYNPESKATTTSGTTKSSTGGAPTKRAIAQPKRTTAAARKAAPVAPKKAATNSKPTRTRKNAVSSSTTPSDIDQQGEEMSVVADSPPPPPSRRSAAPRRAAANKKAVVEVDDEGDDEGMVMIDSDSEVEIIDDSAEEMVQMPAARKKVPPSKSKKAPATKRTTAAAKAAPPPQRKPAPKPTPKPKPVPKPVSDDDDDDDDDDGFV